MKRTGKIEIKVSKFYYLIIALIFFWPIITLVLGITIANFKPYYWIIAFIIFLILWIVGKYNNIVMHAQKVNQAAGGIDVYLKQRFDLIPNLVETVKGYAKHEKEIIQEVTRLRSEYQNSDMEDLGVAEKLNNKFTKVLVTIESYPELKANEGFMNLQKQLSKVESQLQAARRIYNSEVTAYNTKVYTIPSNIIANLFGFKPANLFEIELNERENVNINL
ncbi:MAG: LemA family protein [Clostridia bacterium]|nr:LemA family protein [Clostridia bacterium]MDD4376352.1 LemA family protein [Clostridia bacterium]